MSPEEYLEEQGFGAHTIIHRAHMVRLLEEYSEKYYSATRCSKVVEALSTCNFPAVYGEGERFDVLRENEHEYRIEDNVGYKIWVLKDRFKEV